MRRLILALCVLLLMAGSAVAQTGTTVIATRFQLSTGPVTIRSGVSASGTPNSVIAGNVGDVFVNVHPTFVGEVWLKTSGSTGNTGWVRVVSQPYAYDLGHPSYASQVSNWWITAAGAADFRYLFADQLHAKTFIADLEQALAGGQIITKSVAVVSSFTCPAAGATATLTVEDLPGASNMPVFDANDAVVLRTFSRADQTLTVADCVGVVSAPDTSGSGTQAWTFTRNAAPNAGTMSAATAVPAGGLALDYGTTGGGYYEVNAVDGIDAVNSPYAQVVTWATAPVAGNKTVRGRFGKLTGITSVANEYGLFAGIFAASDGHYFRASNSAFELHGIDLSLWQGSTKTFLLDHSTPSFALGATVPSAYGTGTGVWMGNDGGTYKFRVGNPAGNRLTWDGSTLTIAGDGAGVTNINGGNIQTGTVTATQIAASTITADKLTVGTGRNLLTNTEFVKGLGDAVGDGSGWRVGWGSDAETWTDGYGLANWYPTYSGAGYITTVGTPVAGHNRYLYGPAVPVKPSTVYEYSVYIGIHRATRAYASIQWFTSAGALISQVDAGTAKTPADGAGGTVLSGYARAGGVVTSPATAASAFLLVRLETSGETNPYLFFTRPMFAEGHTGQTTVSEWGPGGVTLITGDTIATGTITANEITASTITSDKIAANTIEAGDIKAGTITTTEIAANTIEAGDIKAGTITATEIASGTITATQIASNTITADRLNVSTLSAIAADMGSLTAGSIVIGSSNKLWLNDSGDGALNIGGGTKGSAPFRVAADGSLVATDATLTGSLSLGDVNEGNPAGDMSNAVALGTNGGLIAGNGTRSVLYGPGNGSNNYYLNLKPLEIDFGKGGSGDIMRLEDASIGAFRDILVDEPHNIGSDATRFEWIYANHIKSPNIVDGTPWPEEHGALASVLGIKGDGHGNLDHATLPLSVRFTAKHKVWYQPQGPGLEKAAPVVIGEQTEEMRNLGAMVSLLTKAMQEQQAQIEALTKRIAELEKK